VPEIRSNSVERPNEIGWFVVHTRTKAEHIAAGMMRSQLGIETYCPRIRFQRATRRGKVWFVEALFPSYFFARFNPAELLRAVRHSQSVLNVVEFGSGLARVTNDVIDLIRTEMKGSDIREVSSPLQPGDEVEITEGAMRGLRGIVESIRPGEERVRILMEFLGSQNPIEVPAHALLVDRSVREMLNEKPR